MSKKSMKETRMCAACGGTAVRDTRPRTIAYKTSTVEIDQPGWWCDDCGETMLDDQDAAIADRAFATLKAKAEHVLPPAEVTRIRKRLHLSQRRAGSVLGGGVRSFQRYEAGAIVVSKPMSNLLALLDHDPNLLDQLAALNARGREAEGSRRRRGR